MRMCGVLSFLVFCFVVLCCVVFGFRQTIKSNENKAFAMETLKTKLKSSERISGFQTQSPGPRNRRVMRVVYLDTEGWGG